MCGMSTDPGAQDGAVPPESAADSDGTADASPPALPNELYEQAMARLAAIQATAHLAVIIDEWQKARCPPPRIADEDDSTERLPDYTDTGGVSPV
jgi:hypothetical protein